MASVTPVLSQASFVNTIANPSSAGAGTDVSSATSQVTSANPTSSSQKTGSQDGDSEAPSQSLSKWLAGAALLIGQERF